MPFQQNQLDRIDTTVDKEAAKALSKGCKQYRKLLIMHIDNCIKKLSAPMVSFDRVNYGLERAFRDGEVASLNKLKEIIE